MKFFRMQQTIRKFPTLWNWWWIDDKLMISDRIRTLDRLWTNWICYTLVCRSFFRLCVQEKMPNRLIFATALLMKCSIRLIGWAKHQFFSKKLPLDSGIRKVAWRRWPHPAATICSREASRSFRYICFSLFRCLNQMKMLLFYGDLFTFKKTFLGDLKRKLFILL